MTPTVRILRWSSGAVSLVTALRTGVRPDGFISATAAFRALLIEPAVGSSITSSLLRDPSFGLNPVEVINDLPAGHVSSSLAGIELAIEGAARREGSWTVGERHVVDTVTDYLQGSGHPYLVHAERLRTAVRDIELGPHFQPETIAGRWHGLIDTSIVIQGLDLESIDWLKETSSEHVVLWAGLSLLNELDLLGYTYRSDRVRRRVSRFAKWLPSRLDQALDPAGYLLRPNVHLRVWGELTVVGARDTDHLETALALRERGVEVRVVTRDLGMLGRARLLGLPSHWLDDRWLLPPVPEREEG